VPGNRGVDDHLGVGPVFVADLMVIGDDQGDAEFATKFRPPTLAIPQSDRNDQFFWPRLASVRVAFLVERNPLQAGWGRSKPTSLWSKRKPLTRDRGGRQSRRLVIA